MSYLSEIASGGTKKIEVLNLLLHYKVPISRCWKVYGILRENLPCFSLLKCLILMDMLDVDVTVRALRQKENFKSVSCLPL